MLKKLLVISSVLSLTSCGTNNNNLNQQIINEQQAEINASKDKNSLFGHNIDYGTATFVFNKSSGEKYLTTNPSSIDLRVKKFGINVGKFNTAMLKMPNKEISGYSYISNDGNVYLNVYSTKDYYKVGTWSTKDKFKGKGYINLNGDIPESLYFQKFDIKIDSSIKDIKAIIPLNPMSDRSLMLISTVDVKPVIKEQKDFDLSKFIATK
ncbi:MAG: hypothetical protein U0354_00850 [Candidatus Sericytochromatia bacterium]